MNRQGHYGSYASSPSRGSLVDILLPQLKPGAPALTILRPTSAVEVALASIVVSPARLSALFDRA
jgi:hypothetical protein